MIVLSFANPLNLGVTSRLNMLARVTGDEVDLQNKKLDEVSRKVS